MFTSLATRSRTVPSTGSLLTGCGDCIFGEHGQGSGENGIRVTTSTEAKIHDNWVYSTATGASAGTRYPAIHVLGTSALASESISIEGNHCYEQHSEGILVYAGSGVTVKSVVISGNITRNSGRVFTTQCGSISVEADSGTLSGAVIKGNLCYRNDSPATDHDGIYLDAEDIVLVGNNVKGDAFNSGSAINRTLAVNLEEGHNLET